MNAPKIHAIRLRGPWLLLATGDFDDCGSETRGEIGKPAAEILNLETDAVRYRRNFNCPTGLQPSDSVHLAVTSWVGNMEVTLNDHSIAPPFDSSVGSVRMEITHLLKPHCELKILICRTHESETKEGEASIGITGEVSLEIHPANSS